MMDKTSKKITKILSLVIAVLAYQQGHAIEVVNPNGPPPISVKAEDGQVIVRMVGLGRRFLPRNYSSYIKTECNQVNGVNIPAIRILIVHGPRDIPGVHYPEQARKNYRFPEDGLCGGGEFRQIIVNGIHYDL